jgi:hypothetical protein
MAKAIINAGICGFKTTVIAESDEMQMVSFNIESDCENIVKMAVDFPIADAYSEIGSGFDGELHKVFRGSLRGCCSGCVVPCGIFKAMQVAAGLALPTEASIELEK